MSLLCRSIGHSAALVTQLQGHSTQNIDYRHGRPMVTKGEKENMTGTIQQRGKNSWRLLVSDGFNADGTRRRITRTVHATSRREAEKELAKLIVEVGAGQHADLSKMTFATFTDRWLRDYAEVNLAPKTVHEYKALLKRILPTFGHIKLAKIKPLHLLEFYRSLQSNGARQDGKKGGLSGNTANHYHRLISSMLGDAVKWQLIPSNPAEQVPPPKIERKRAPHYDEAQTAAMLEALATESLKYQVMINVAIFGGLRRGELMGLTWPDINFEEDTITINQASQYIPGTGSFTKPPKTDSSARTIKMPKATMSMLRTLKRVQSENILQCGELWQGDNEVFTSDDGKRMHPDTITKWWRKFIKRHELPEMNFHGLRHTSATLLISEGISATNVSSRLGHASTSTTVNIYAHALKSKDQEAADRFDGMQREMASRTKACKK